MYTLMLQMLLLVTPGAKKIVHKKWAGGETPEENRCNNTALFR